MEKQSNVTHDFQPIIDFVINNKPIHSDYVSVYFLRNQAGKITEQEITATDVKSLPILLAENAKNECLNKIHRMASLRKLIEHMPKNPEQDLAYILLSCLFHGKMRPVYKNGTELTSEEIKSGEEFIKKYVADFEYVIIL